MKNDLNKIDEITNNFENNLIVKATKRNEFKKFSSKAFKIIKKALLTLVIASVAAVSACTVVTTTNPGNNPGTNPGTDPGTNPGEQTQHSELLLDILEDNYYDQTTQEFYDAKYFLQKADAIPYQFLIEQGHDVEKLKTNELSAYSIIYTLGDDKNNIYLSNRIENEGIDTYYTFYTLKYPLTNQEYDDMVMLFENNYIQSGYFIQELAKQKEPTVIADVNTTKKYYDDFYKKFKNSEAYVHDILGTDKIEIDFLNFSKEEQTFSIAVRTDTSECTQKGMVYTNAEIRHMDLIPSFNPITTVSYDDTIYNGPIYFNSTNFEEYKSNSIEITYFYNHKNLYNIFDLKSDLVNEI